MNSNKTYTSNLIEIVYFILNEKFNTIKIGYTTNLKKRLSQLQTSNSEKLIIHATFLGDKTLEQYLHKYFSSCHIRNEWFYFNNEFKKLLNNFSRIYDKEHEEQIDNKKFTHIGKEVYFKDMKDYNKHLRVLIENLKLMEELQQKIIKEQIEEKNNLKQEYLMLQKIYTERKQM